MAFSSHKTIGSFSVWLLRVTKQWRERELEVLGFCQADWNVYLHLFGKATSQLPFLPLQWFTQITVLVVTYLFQMRWGFLHSRVCRPYVYSCQGLRCEFCLVVLLCVAVLHIMFFSNSLHSTMCGSISSVIAVLVTSEDERKIRNNNYLSVRHDLLRESKS